MTRKRKLAPGIFKKLKLGYNNKDSINNRCLCGQDVVKTTNKFDYNQIPYTLWVSFKVAVRTWTESKCPYIQYHDMSLINIRYTTCL